MFFSNFSFSCLYFSPFRILRRTCPLAPLASSWACSLVVVFFEAVGSRNHRRPLKACPQRNPLRKKMGRSLSKITCWNRIVLTMPSLSAKIFITKSEKAMLWNFLMLLSMKTYWGARTTRNWDTIGPIKVSAMISVCFDFDWRCLLDNVGDVSEKNLEKKRQALDALHQSEGELNDQLSALESSISALRSTPANDALGAEIERLQSENETFEKRLADAKSNAKSITKSDADKLDSTLTSQIAAWRKRKSIAVDALQSISEGNGKSVKATGEEMGVETDEDAGVSLSRIADLLAPPSKRQKK